MPELELASGIYFNLGGPSVDSIRIEDIAHHLSHICRSNGAFSEFCSVAEHSTLVSRMMRTHGADNKMQLAGLLHDAHESYLGDITRPTAQLINQLAGHGLITRIKNTFDDVICRKFNMSIDDMCSPGVKHWDDVALAIEAYWLLPSKGMTAQWSWLPFVDTKVLVRYRPACQAPRTARLHFLATYNRLVEEAVNG